MTEHASQKHRDWRHRVFAICGSTATGKTSIAIDVAMRCDAEIISIDAFQCYRGLGILTAAPSPEQLHAIPHHLIGCFQPDEEINSHQFRNQVEQAIESILARQKLPLLAGGNGHYLDMVFQPPDHRIPPPDPDLRRKLESIETDTLLSELDRIDPLAGQKIDRKNRRRLIRALEVCKLTGTPYSQMRDDWSAGNYSKPSNGVTLVMNRQTLHSKIARRVDDMLANGAVEEVMAIGSCSKTAAGTLGYREINNYLAGNIDLNTCRNSIIAKTMQYAKRQATWFRNQTQFPEIALDKIPREEAIESILEMVSAKFSEPRRSSHP